MTVKKLEDLKVELETLYQEVAQIYNEGRVLMDCWIARAKPGSGKNKYPRLKSRKPIFNGKRTEYLSVQGTAVEEAQAAIARGRMVKKLQKRIAQLTERLQRLQNRATKSNPAPTEVSLPECYTPPSLLALVMQLWGMIDLDPASDAEAQTWIQASTYYTIAQNGLEHPWFGRVWLHPPTQGKTGRWIKKLFQEYQSGRVLEALVLVKPAVGNKWFQRLIREGWVCFPNERIIYADAKGNPQGPKRGRVIFYLGAHPDAFQHVFGAIGSISIPATRSLLGKGPDAVPVVGDTLLE